MNFYRSKCFYNRNVWTVNGFLRVHVDAFVCVKIAHRRKKDPNNLYTANILSLEFILKSDEKTSPYVWRLRDAGRNDICEFNAHFHEIIKECWNLNL